MRKWSPQENLQRNVHGSIRPNLPPAKGSSLTVPCWRHLRRPRNSMLRSRYCKWTVGWHLSHYAKNVWNHSTTRDFVSNVDSQSSHLMHRLPFLRLRPLQIHPRSQKPGKENAEPERDHSNREVLPGKNKSGLSLETKTRSTLLER